MKKRKKNKKEKQNPIEVKTIHAVVLMGNIGTGKTTYANKLVNSYGFVRLCHDSLVDMIAFGKYNKKDRQLYHEVETMIIAAFCKLQKDFIIDRTNITKQDRKKWIDLIKTYEYYAPHIKVVKIGIDFGKGNDKTLGRVIKRECDKKKLIVDNHLHAHKVKEVKKLWERVYGLMYNGYEELALDEGFDFVQTINKE